ncbi:MAG TPA: NADH-quinone oxidoreductase subunit C [Steroidobacteraceae bacterium]|nr:NADH-quinone oxidoreductase subunit C [Steroidobacteraceae bacterium]
MNQALETLAEQISARFGDKVGRVPSRCGELTFEVAAEALVELCTALRDDPEWSFEELIDLCGVDYLQYGCSEWNTETATFRGFSRGVNPTALTRPAADLSQPDLSQQQPGRGEERGEDRRFAVVYHLLSIKTNRRLRLRAWCGPGEPPIVDSVIEVWKAADWFEREAFDLYGILFRGHPDLRRLLTDYGFLGHPFRKDFPLSGNVEVRYDPTKGRVVYEPVSIEPRTLVPRVIREDNRYAPALKDVPRNG